MNRQKNSEIIHELRHHLPFSLTSSIIAAIIVIILFSINKTFFVSNMPKFFEIIHPAHIFVSAIATSAVYHKYKKSRLYSILIGILGAITIGTLSDVVLPWLAGNIFSLHTHFHAPILEEPILILSIATIGSLTGSIWSISKSSHTIHVFLSVLASLSYILAFSISINFATIILISLIVFIAVYIPCCISDIVFPLLFVKKKCEHRH